MATDYYDDDAARTSEPEPDDQHDAVKGDESTSQQALLPKSILAGKTFEVGDEVVLKIDEIRGDEVVVSYASGEDKPKDAGDMEEMPAGGGDNPGGGMYD